MSRRLYRSALHDELLLKERVERALWHKKQNERLLLSKPRSMVERALMGRRNARMRGKVTLPQFVLPDT